MDKFILAKETGKIIKQLRKERKLTQKDLASELSLSRTVISKWESGDRIPTTKQYCDLALFFNVSVANLSGIEKERRHIRAADNSPSLESPFDLSAFNNDGLLVLKTIYDFILTNPNLTKPTEEK